MTTGRPHPAAPVVGLNHNLRYDTRVFHIQTEDSGVQHRYIATHVFLGGHVVASVRAAYRQQSDVTGAELAALVRQQMELQHKTVARALLSGKHDADIMRLTSVNAPVPATAVAPVATAAKVTLPPTATRAQTPLESSPSYATLGIDAFLTDEIVVRHLASEPDDDLT